MRVLAVRDADVRRVWLPGSLILVLVLYLSTLQTAVNGSEHPYATDVGEIQNALPRWGTIHEPGYPLYSLGGSLFVTVLRAVGVGPAAGASLYSTAWGVATVAALYWLARELGAGPPYAAAAALVAGLSTSMWVDASLAEIHTMGAALTVAALLLAARFRRTGARGDLLALVAMLAHGVVHQRTTLFLAPALLLLVWPRRREALGHWRPALGVALTAPLAYLYLLMRGAMGSRWTFGAVGEWRGLLDLALDSKVSKVVVLPGDLAGWLERLRMVGGLLHDDLWLPVLLLGLGGVWLLARRRDGAHRGAGWRVPLAFTLAWLPSLALSLVIWEGRVSDALLAAKLPLALIAGVGLAIALQSLADGRARRRWAARALAVGVLAAQVGLNRPAVLAVTRDTSALEAVTIAERVPRPLDGAPGTLMALWGHRYWALTYAQAYEGRLPGLTLVDHNANLAEIVRREGRILTLSETLYHLPLAGWDERLGQAHLSSPAPGIIEVRSAPILGAPDDEGQDLGNGIRILSADLRHLADGAPWLEVTWRAERAVDADYSVAVHVLARPEPAGRQDILAQADRTHPVDGWYPTSRWAPGETVVDAYLLPEASPSVRAQAVRLAMYRQAPDGGFETTPWLTLPLPTDD